MKLNAAVASALADPEIARKLVQSGAIPTPTTPEEFGTLLKDELARWGRVVREKGLKDS
jgi:tripartite-type tricarboxylate transporter receptor subunit TctC